MGHDAELMQKEFLKNKGKGPSVVELSNEVEHLKVKVNSLELRLELMGKMNLQVQALERKIELMGTIHHD